MSQPLFQVPSQPIFLSLTGNGFADPGLFSGVSAREAGGVWRSAYLPLDQAVCLSPCDVSVWINGGGVAAGMGFTGLCSEPYCSPWARPKCHPIHAWRLAGKYGGSAKAWPRGLPQEVFMEVFMEDPCGQVLPQVLRLSLRKVQNSTKGWFLLWGS